VKDTEATFFQLDKLYERFENEYLELWEDLYSEEDIEHCF
jgi:hypothetical protein